MTVHPRSDWTPSAAAGPPLLDAELLGSCIHWQGVPVTDPTPEVLRADRRYHMEAKGWDDIAYNLAVDQAGDIWDARGIDRRSSANGTTPLNRQYVAVVALLGPGQTPSAAMLDGLRLALAIIQTRYPRATAVVDHGAIRPGGTQCPGPELTAAVRSGALTPAQPPTEEPLMARHAICAAPEGVAGVIIVEDLGVWHAVAANAEELVNAGWSSIGGTVVDVDILCTRDAAGDWLECIVTGTAPDGRLWLNAYSYAAGDWSGWAATLGDATP
jgi:hypothetical protein